MSGPRNIIEALSRRGSMPAIVDHLAAHGPSSAQQISDRCPITRAAARAQLLQLRAAGAAELEDQAYRWVADSRTHRYYLDPDALRYAARWLDALAERAERSNRAAADALVPTGWAG